MKKITFILFAILGIGLLFSCEKKETEPVLDMGKAIAPALAMPAADTIALTQEEADSLITFNWSPVSYNLSNLEATTYTLQIDLADSNFVHAVNLGSTTATSFQISYGALNSNLMTMGLEPNVASVVEMRVISFMNANAAISTLHSNVISLNLTPFSSAIEYPKLWVPGDYQGWAPADAPVIYDFDGDGIYTGYIYFPDNAPSFAFKFTSVPNWDDGTNYGAGAAAGTLSTDGGAGNLEVPGPGGYQFVVDINNLTWSYTLQNWGVIGEWLGWSEDINLVWDIVTQDLSVTVPNIPAADNQRFKFRANDGWDVNLGANDPDDGFLKPGGDDIPIPDGGNITFILRFTTPEPSYEVIYN